MWFVSKTGIGLSRPYTEKVFIHVAKNQSEAATQLESLVTKREIEQSILKPCPIPATKNGRDLKLYKVRAKVPTGQLFPDGTKKYKWQERILSATDEDDASLRARRYIADVEPLSDINAHEIEGVHKITQKEIKTAFFGK